MAPFWCLGLPGGPFGPPQVPKLERATFRNESLTHFELRGADLCTPSLRSKTLKNDAFRSFSSKLAKTHRRSSNLSRLRCNIALCERSCAYGCVDGCVCVCKPQSTPGLRRGPRGPRGRSNTPSLRPQTLTNRWFSKLFHRNWPKRVVGLQIYHVCGATARCASVRVHMGVWMCMCV